MKKQFGGIVYPQTMGLSSPSPSTVDVEKAKLEEEKKKAAMDAFMKKLEDKNRKP